MGDPIIISDSDSDLDYELGSDDDAFSTNVGPEGYGEHSGNVFSPGSASGSMVRPLHPGFSAQTEAPGFPGIGASRPLASQRNVSSQKNAMDHQDKRASTSSFHIPVSHRKPNNLRDSEHMHQINGSGNSHPFAGPSSWNGNNHEKQKFDNGVVMLDKDGTGSLPFWARPMPISSGHYASSFDPIDPFKNGDERIGGTDERSVFQEVIQDLNQPKQEADIPDGLLSVPLLRHQKIALAWMRQKEARPFCVGGILADDQGLGKTISTIALIQMERNSEQKSKYEDHKTEALNLDDDDNGIVNLDDAKPIEDSNDINFFTKGCSSQQLSSKKRPAAGTLVVCPATVLRQWARELVDKVTEDAKLKVLIYHGSNRTKDPSELATYDVVLTTYAIVTNEVPKQSLAEEDDPENGHGAKRKNPSSFSKKGKKGKKTLDSCSFDSDSGALAKVRWLRVVLDEAQTIKNHRTQAARACCGLRAKKRWCLSGTPIQNAIEELFSYFRFLKYDPYSSYKAFCEGIKFPISRDSKSGYQKLQVVLRTVMLRRTKGTLIDGQPIINLPPKYIKMKSVEFTFEEKEFYAKLEASSRMQFKAYAAAGTLNQNYANILLMLLRLRQACDHPHLVSGSGSEFDKKPYSMQTLRQIPKEKLSSLLIHLEDLAICVICKDPPEDAVISVCGHVFCYQCVLDHLAGDDPTCPGRKCKEQLSTDVVFSKATLRSFLSDGSESSLSNSDPRGESMSVMSSDYPSSKIRAALEILQSLGEASVPCIDLDGTPEDGDLKSDPAVHVRTQIINSDVSKGRKKAIVFSQWTRMLNLMEASLKQCGIHYRRLDGTMSLAARDKAVREFNLDPEVDVMLMSLKAGNLGLNMVAACHVILLDLWWNPTTEDQAVDRAHRIGQTRAVTVSRLTIKDTVEDRILALQEEKRKMVASAFGEENGGVSARLTAHDLRFLFKMGKFVKEWKITDDIVVLEVPPTTLENPSFLRLQSCCQRNWRGTHFNGNSVGNNSLDHGSNSRFCVGSLNSKPTQSASLSPSRKEKVNEDEDEDEGS